MFAIFNRFAIETHKSTDSNVCLRVCVNGLCVRANVCKFLVVCLFVCVCGRVCVSLWMCIPANVSFPVCVSCLNTVVSVCGSVCVSLWMCIPVNVSFPVCCFCLDTIVFVGTSVSPWICLLACAVFEWICACLTVCQKACWGRVDVFPSVSLYMYVCVSFYVYCYKTPMEMYVTANYPLRKHEKL